MAAQQQLTIMRKLTCRACWMSTGERLCLCPADWWSRPCRTLDPYVEMVAGLPYVLRHTGSLALPLMKSPLKVQTCACTIMIVKLGSSGTHQLNNANARVRPMCRLRLRDDAQKGPSACCYAILIAMHRWMEPRTNHDLAVIVGCAPPQCRIRVCCTLHRSTCPRRSCWTG